MLDLLLCIQATLLDPVYLHPYPVHQLIRCIYGERDHTLSHHLAKVLSARKVDVYRTLILIFLLARYLHNAASMLTAGF